MEQTSKSTIPDLAESLAEAMPVLDRRQQELALELYRRLALGAPVPPSTLASELGCDEAEVVEALERWPGVFRDGDGRVTSFWGLAIPEMAHRFRVDGRRLFTWSAWDALFIPELIGHTAEVESRSPAGGAAVRLIVDPDGVREVDPETVVVSMLAPEEAFDQRVISSFCHFVHFFATPEEAAEWASEHAGTFVLSVFEAHELGRLVNRRRFDRVLRSAASGGRWPR
jgi:alkylmercury lyase